jgi:hypothetical protein
MPLVRGKSEKSFKKNVAQLIKDGYSKREAVAIAFSIKREAKKS